LVDEIVDEGGGRDRLGSPAHGEDGLILLDRDYSVTGIRSDDQFTRLAGIKVHQEKSAAVVNDRHFRMLMLKGSSVLDYDVQLSSGYVVLS